MVEFANHPALQSAVGDYGDFLSDDQMRYIAEARGKFDSYVATLQSEAKDAGRTKVARSLKQQELDASIIAQATGFSVDEIEQLN